MKKEFFVTLQAKATVRFTRLVKAADEDAAKRHLLNLFEAIDNKLTSQCGQCIPFLDAVIEIIEPPHIDQDFQMQDMQVEETTFI